MKIDVPKKLEPLKWWGFEPVYKTGEELIGFCVFCTDPKHFYINYKTGKWNCKICGRFGNISSFLTQLSNLVSSETKKSEYQKLADARELPIRAFRRYKLGWDGEYWILTTKVPNKNDKLIVKDLRRWKTSSKKLMGTQGCQTHLFGLCKLKEKIRKATIWLCEGEWDVIALEELFVRGNVSKNNLCIGVPGAQIFKKEWKLFFQNKHINICFDNDEPGYTGMARVGKTLKNTAKSIHYIHWPKSKQEGFDICDFVTRSIRKDIKPVLAIDKLQKFLKKKHPHPKVFEETLVSEKPDFIVLPKKERPTFSDILKKMKGFIKVDKEIENTLRYLLSICISQQLEGDPLWGYLVGPPGSGKTLIANMFNTSDRTIFRSSITPHALVSGFRSDKDPSLIPKANHHILVIKDGTEILAQPENTQEQVYGILRGAYDGSVFREYGNRVVRNYKNLHFTVIICVTPTINAHNRAMLGDRFIKFQIKSRSSSLIASRVLSAIDSVSSKVVETKEQAETAELLRRFLAFDIKHFPEVPKWIKNRLLSLCMFISVLRANVEREKFGEALLYRPEPEYGTRIAKQLTKLLRSVSIVNNERKITEKSLKFVERVAYDTTIEFNLDVIDAIMKTENAATRDEIISRSGIPSTTLQHYLNDLIALKAIVRKRMDVLNVGRPTWIYAVKKDLVTFWKQCRG